MSATREAPTEPVQGGLRLLPAPKRCTVADIGRTNKRITVSHLAGMTSRRDRCRLRACTKTMTQQKGPECMIHRPIDGRMIQKGLRPCARPQQRPGRHGKQMGTIDVDAARLPPKTAKPLHGVAQMGHAPALAALQPAGKIGQTHGVNRRDVVLEYRRKGGVARQKDRKSSLVTGAAALLAAADLSPEPAGRARRTPPPIHGRDALENKARPIQGCGGT